MNEPQKPKRQLPKRVQRAVDVSKRLHQRIKERKARERAAQEQLAGESRK